MSYIKEPMNISGRFPGSCTGSFPITGTGATRKCLTDMFMNNKSLYRYWQKRRPPSQSGT